MTMPDVIARPACELVSCHWRTVADLVVVSGIGLPPCGSVPGAVEAGCDAAVMCASRSSALFLCVSQMVCRRSWSRVKVLMLAVSFFKC